MPSWLVIPRGLSTRYKAHTKLHHQGANLPVLRSKRLHILDNLRHQFQLLQCKTMYQLWSYDEWTENCYKNFFKWICTLYNTIPINKMEIVMFIGIQVQHSFFPTLSFSLTIKTQPFLCKCVSVWVTHNIPHKYKHPRTKINTFTLLTPRQIHPLLSCTQQIVKHSSITCNVFRLRFGN